MIDRLTTSERTERLLELEGWTYDVARAALHRRVTFVDFAAALGAMVRIGVVAERMDHHPEWTNVYDRLYVWLTTHDAGGVTSRDVALAKAIDGIVAST